MYAAIALPELPKEPHQSVKFSFHERSFGQKKPVHCNFQGKWFSKWHYYLCHMEIQLLPDRCRILV